MHSSAPLEVIEEKVQVVSEGLRLDGRLSYPSSGRADNTALVLPAHPFLGGDMNGSVVKALTATLAAQGFMTLSFNYRGIGESESDADIAIYQKEFWENSTSPEYEKKIFTDSETAFRFLATASGAAALSVVGYSFGTLPALGLALRHAEIINRACLISPPVVKWDMQPEHFRLSCAKAFYYAPGDFACPEDKLKATYEKFHEPKALVKIDSRDHFYLGQEEVLALEVASFLKKGKT